MADVKWQYQRHVVAEEMRVSPGKTEDVVDAPLAQRTQEQEEVVEIATAAVAAKRPSRVVAMQPVEQPQLVHDLVADGAQQMQHHEVSRTSNSTAALTSAAALIKKICVAGLLQF